MNFFSGFGFFAWLAVMLVPAVAIGLRERSMQNYILFSSFAFIFLIYRSRPAELIYLACFYAISLLIVKSYLYVRVKYGRSRGLYYIFLGTAIVPLIVSKTCLLVAGEAEEILKYPFMSFTGISYLTFRVVQIIIEIYDGPVSRVDVKEFTAFILFFPAISAGPIDRSRRFGEDFGRICTRDEYAGLLGDGLMKIMQGLVYKVVIASGFYKLTGMFAESSEWYVIVIYMYCYGFYLFFDFAGYSSMAIGTGYLMGIRMPENFNRPFAAKDIKDFWNRWHMSLSFWFRDFVFSRFIMSAVRNRWLGSRLQRAAAGYIIDMLVMGAWHGFRLNYIIYGLYHGILLAVTDIYQKKSGFYKRHKNEKWYICISWFVTLNAVMLGFLIFSGRKI